MQGDTNTTFSHIPENEFLVGGFNRLITQNMPIQANHIEQ